MGRLKDEVNIIIKKSGGLIEAKKDAIEWYKKTALNIGDNSVQLTGSTFLPGKIYIFRYEHPKTEDKLEWWDLNPLVLSLGRYEGKDIGINLNLIPFQNKLQFLDKIYNYYYSKIISKIKHGRGEAINESAIFDLNYDKIKNFLKLTGLDFAVRLYITSLRKQTYVVSFSKWNYVALIDLANIKNVTINKVYSQFRKHFKNKNK